MELSFYLNFVRRWLWLLALAAILASLAAVWVTWQQPPVYMAQAKLIVGPGIGSANPDLNALRTGGQLMQTYAQLATTGPVLQAVISELGLKTTPELLARKIDIKADAETQILTVRVRDGAAVRAASVANSLAGLLVRMGSSSGSVSQAQQLAQVTSDSAKFKQIADESASKIEQLQAQLQTPIVETQKAIAEHEAKIQALEADLQKPTDPVIVQQMREQQVKVKNLEAALQATMDLTARRMILDQITLEYNRLSDAQTAENTQKRTLLDQLSWERSRLDDAQKAETDRLALIRDQISQEQARQSEAQRNLTQLSAMLQPERTNQLQIIEYASTGSPVTTPLALTLLVAGGAGLMAALMVALVFEYFDKTIKSAEELGRIPGTVLLGTVPKHKRPNIGMRERLAVRFLPDTLAAESYRMIGTKLLTATGDGRSTSRSLLIASVEPGDSSAEVAANLGVTFAEMGKQVVLADVNLRDLTLSRMFGVGEGPGLSDMLSVQSKRSEPLPLEQAPNLSLIPAGSAAANPFELLASPRFESILKEFTQENDLLIVATGGLLSFAENLVIATRADGLVLVVRAGLTSREALAEAIETLHRLHVNFLGVILC